MQRTYENWTREHYQSMIRYENMLGKFILFVQQRYGYLYPTPEQIGQKMWYLYTVWHYLHAVINSSRFYHMTVDLRRLREDMQRQVAVAQTPLEKTVARMVIRICHELE